MPNRSHATFPRFNENGTEHASSQIIEKTSQVDSPDCEANIHLPHIRNDTPGNSKSERKPGRFFKFSNDRNSFTENLLSFFTGNKDRGNHKSNAPTTDSEKPRTTAAKESGLRNRTENRHGVLTRNERSARSHVTHNTHQKHPLQRTEKSRITALTKNDSFRPVTGRSRTRASNGAVAKKDNDSDIGGYENMYKMKQPPGKFNVPRKRSLEINEYIRRENYKYNERTAKQFLFQKWLRSTETELPEHYPIEHNDTKLSK